MNNNNIITVTSPLLPPINEYFDIIKDVWDSKWITNNGKVLQELEHELSKYLRVDFISVYTNGTLPLLTALQILEIKGEVITTPYSFVATSNVLLMLGIKPVFVDIDPETGNMNPELIEKAITKKTTAILPVHVYGTPCDFLAIDSIAKKHNLKVVYDAAHAFGVSIHGNSILNYGDISTLSFHATKTYNTVEGGALVCKEKQLYCKSEMYKNFGFESDTSIIGPGLNSKMDETRAAFGLINLKYIEEAIQKRRKVSVFYKEKFKNISGLRMLEEIENIKYNYSYFPIFIDEHLFGISRDALFEKMVTNKIISRKYFYPLISNMSYYQGFPSAQKKLLPEANKMANSVICLPIHHLLTEQDLERIVATVIPR